MRLGIDRFLKAGPERFSSQRLGILAHQASVTSAGGSTVEELLKGKGWEVTALFGPEHGLKTIAQDMEPVSSTTDHRSNLPVHSLYGDTLESLKPTAEMLAAIDVLVVDLQDIGTRYYTYVWTTVLCMQACAAAGKKVIVCDRPNPLGGVQKEGGGIRSGFESFVGLYSIPVRHGLTIGELAQLMNEREQIGCDLTVIGMEGWEREMHWPDTGLEWINPSPNMRSYEAAFLYPGLCLLEATNCSEGRGTETPFETIGAPYIKSEELIGRFNELKLPGIAATPCSFTPTHQKQAGQECEGIRWQISDREAFRPYLTGLALVWLLHRLYSQKGFEWRKEPYEFVTDIPAIDLLTGSNEFRNKITTKDFQEFSNSSFCFRL